MSTTQSDTQLDNATTNVLHDEEEQRDHLIEVYLVVEDEEKSIYDATLIEEHLRLYYLKRTEPTFWT
jgi:hypothetical protein